MKAYGKTVLILLSFLTFAHCTDVRTTGSGDVENGVEPNAVVGGSGEERPEIHEPNATAAAGRTGRQYYQPAVGFAYQPYPQRRAYKGPYPTGRQRARAKPGRRQRPRRRPAAAQPPPVPPHLAMQARYRRLPPALRPQHTNYIDSPPLTDYDDGFESPASFDYGEREFGNEPATAFVHYGPNVVPMAVVPSLPSTAVRSRKRPALAAADEPQAVVHVPVMRVQARPFATAAPTAATTVAVAAATVDPMEKLRQMVQEAMDEHFANRHQELYTDGFDKQQQQQQQQGQAKYSAKYKRQQAAAAGQDKQQRPADDAAVSYAPSRPPLSSSSSPSAKKSDVSYASRTPPSDADADGSEDRLTLAEISAYMGSKPAETVLSTGGRRYVLSEALQQIYQRPQQPDHQHQRQYDGEDNLHGLHRGQQYLRYVSPFEAIYELPAARWTYK